MEDLTICTPENFARWKVPFLNKVLLHNESGAAICHGTPYILTYPLPGSSVMCPDTGEPILDADGEPISAYDFTEHGIMTAQSKKEYRHDLQRYTTDKRKFENDSRAVISLIHESCSAESRTIVAAHIGYPQAFASGDAYRIFEILTETHSLASPRLAMLRVKSLFGLTQASCRSYEHFVEELLIALDFFVADFGSTKEGQEGMIDPQHIAAVIFIMGVDQSFFQYKIDSIMANTHDAKLDGWREMLPDFQSYKSQRSDSVSEPPPTSAYGALAPLLCIECHAPFPHKTGQNGKPFSMCIDCARKRRVKLNAKSKAKALVAASVSDAALATAAAAPAATLPAPPCAAPPSAAPPYHMPPMHSSAAIANARAILAQSQAAGNLTAAYASIAGRVASHRPDDMSIVSDMSEFDYNPYGGSVDWGAMGRAGVVDVDDIIALDEDVGASPETWGPNVAFTADIMERPITTPNVDLRSGTPVDPAVLREPTFAEGSKAVLPGWEDTPGRMVGRAGFVDVDDVPALIRYDEDDGDDAPDTWGPSVAFTASVVPRYIDNCCSLSITPDASLLSGIQPIKPFPIDGLNGHVQATHVGILPGLPPPYQRCFLAPGSSATLLSLGDWNRLGATFSGDAAGVLHICDASGHEFVACPRERNNVWRVPPSLFLRQSMPSLTRTPMHKTRTPVHKGASSSGRSVTPLSTVSPIACLAVEQATALMDLPSSASAHGLHPVGFPAISWLSKLKVLHPQDQAQVVSASTVPTRYNREQLARCDAVEALRRHLHFPSDGTLGHSLNHGSFPHSDLTSTDVRMNRALRGPDPHALAGKMTQKNMPPSTNAPASSPGHTLVMDPHMYRDPTPAGNTHGIRIADEFSGQFDIVSAKSKSMENLFKAVMTYIRVEYNAYGHYVEHIHVDSEHVLRYLRPAFGMVGILLSLSPPGQHAQRVERYVRTLNEKKQATFDNLPFVIPAKYDIYLEKSIANAMNKVVNSRSHPMTPLECTQGKRAAAHYKYPTLHFGATCMVHLGDGKRKDISAYYRVPRASVPKSELGVCFGVAPEYPGCYWFLVASGTVVPRRVLEVVNALPFGWKAKPTVQLILPPQPTVLASPSSPPVLVSGGDVSPGPAVDRDSFVPVDITIPPPPQEPSSPLLCTSSAPPAAAPSAATPSVPLPLPVAIDIPVAPVLVAPPPLPELIAPASPVVQGEGVQGGRLRRNTVSGQLEEVHTSDTPSRYPLRLHANIAATQRQCRVNKAVAAAHADRLHWDELMEGQYDHLAAPAALNSVVSTTPAPIPRRESAQGVGPIASLMWLLTLAATSGVVPSLPLTVEPAPSDATLPLPSPTASPLLDEVDSLLAAYLSTSGDACEPPHVVNAPSLGKISASSPVDGPPESGVPFIPDKDFVPAFPTRMTKEMSSRQARLCLSADDMAAAENGEMEKLTTTHTAIRSIAYEDVHSDAVRVYCQFLYKEKHEDALSGAPSRVTCRCAANGNRQPSDSFGETYAPTADGTSRLLALAAFQADAIKNGYIDDLGMSDFDVKGAFLHVPLDSKRQVIMKLPSDISHPLAGQWVEVLKSIYGLKQSNHSFDADLRKVILSAGFVTTRDPCIYVKTHSAAYVKANPDSHHHRCILSTHVDDGFGVYSHRPFWDDLLGALTERYGPLTTNDVTTSYTGIAFTRSPSGAITLSQRGYLLRLLGAIGMADVKPISTPSSPDFFHVSPDNRPVDTKLFGRMVGVLIWALKTRFDIQKEVIFLATRLASPTRGDVAKVVRVLRYLRGQVDMGPTYYTQEGAVLCAHVDASYGVHVDGRSQTGYYLSIGRYSAPFLVHAGSQRSCVSLGSMMAEYVALAEVGRAILWCRFLLDDIGFPQRQPTIIYEDNQSAINLAVAPHITRKSRHIHIRHHFIRDLVAKGIVQIVHLPTHLMTADILTKPLGPTAFIALRDILMNVCCLHLPSLPDLPASRRAQT
jgi:hypothetical protein